MIFYDFWNRIKMIDYLYLNKKCNWLRNEILNILISSKKGHIGGSLSCVEILISLYYGNILKYDINNTKWVNRDKFILSKGHASLSLYPILYNLGYINKNIYISPLTVEINSLLNQKLL